MSSWVSPSKGGVGGVEHIAYLAASQILVAPEAGHGGGLAIEGWPALVIGRLQVVDEGGPLLGVSQPYHQIRLTGLHLFECPSPGHPFEGEHNAAACLQLAQNVDIQPLEVVVLCQHAKRRPDIGGHRQGRRTLRPAGKQQTKRTPACLAHPAFAFFCYILVS